jgi:hypothetical protein
MVWPRPQYGDTKSARASRRRYAPQLPYPILALTGEPGTSKTSIAAVLRGLVDPHIAASGGRRRKERDLFITASKSGVLFCDNMSFIAEWLGDSLRVVATGGTYTTRPPRTDADEVLFTRRETGDDSASAR